MTRSRGINRRRRPDGVDPLDWILTNIDTSTECWIWQGNLQIHGYGRLSVDKHNVLVHRYVWKRLVGTIPAGLVVDHKCRVRACCNPEHLRIVTPKVNLTENVVGSGPQVMRAKTHCPQGHPYAGTNLYVEPSGGRKCRSCVAAAVRRYEKRRREALRR